MNELKIGMWVTQYCAGFWQIVDLKPKYAEKDMPWVRKGEADRAMGPDEKGLYAKDEVPDRQ